MNKIKVISLIKKSSYWIKRYNKVVNKIKDKKLLNFDNKYGYNRAGNVPMFSFNQLDPFCLVINKLSDDIIQLIKIYNNSPYGGNISMRVLLNGEQSKIQDVIDHIRDAKDRYYIRVNKLFK